MRYIAAYPAQTDRDVPPPTFGVEPYIHPTSQVYASMIGSWTEIGANSLIVDSTLGDYSYTDGDALIIYTEIGKFCSIASHVRINPGNHPMDRVSQHHFTYRRQQYGFDMTDDATFFDWRKSHPCTIGHDVWIGHAATIMPGVKVGTGAVIGAGAVVTKEVVPYQIIGGVPAKPIRQRFPDHIAEKLLEIAWWDWDRATMVERFQDFLDVPTFVEKYGR